MGEIKGAIISILIFICFFIPTILLVGIDVIHNQGFMKTTSEVTELVKKEGGVTSTVLSSVDKLEDRGYNIRFYNENGQQIRGFVGYGKTVYIEYQYTYHNIFGNKTLRTKNQVFNMNRS